MKLTTVFLIAGFLQLSAKGYSQKVSIDKENISIEQILIEINRQTGFSYSAKDSILKNSKAVNVHVRNAEIGSVLNQILKDQALTYSIVGRVIILKQKSKIVEKSDVNEGDFINVKGRVVNEKGEAVIASVSVKGLRKGTSTNSSGEFLLKEIDPNSTIVITGVNIQTFEIQLNGRSDLSTLIAKQKIVDVEEVVVANTGYQKVKPNETNGSIIVIDNKTLNEQTGTNILQRINGVANGVLFDIGKKDAKGNPNLFTVRGLSTIVASIAPLIVLDNFPYDGAIENINPNDVESVTILKDAAATSIYGVRGGNGVVIITTKKSRFNQKVNIQANVSLIVSGQPDTYYTPIISSSDYIDVEQFLFNKGYDFDGALYSAYNNITPAVDIFLKRKAGLITSADSAQQIDALKKIDSRKDFDKYFYSNPITQQYSVSVGGGSNNVAWMVSSAYEKNITTLKAMSDKINFRIGNTYKVWKNAEIGTSFYYTSGSTHSGKPSPLNLRLRNVPYISFADAKGNPLAIPTKYRQAFLDTAGSGQLLDWRYYPLEDYKHNISTSKSEALIADLTFKWQFWNGFTLDIGYQYQKGRTENNQIADINSYYTRNLINSFTNLNTVDPELKNPIPYGSVFISSNESQVSQSFRIQNQVNKTYGNHTFSVFSGFEVRKVYGLGGDRSTYYGYNDKPLRYSIVDFIAAYPTYPFGNSSSIPGQPGLTSETFNHYVSVYANGSYTFKRKYSISASGRKDAANIFGLNANDKWTPLWSAALGWELSKEKYYHWDLIPDLKMKLSYGYSGNLDLSKTASTQIIFRPGGTPHPAGVPIAGIVGFPNDDLKWEKVHQINLGFSFNSINNTVSGTIEIYQKRGLNLYGGIPIDYTAVGLISGVVRNVANMRGRGIDVQLETKVIDKGFKWATTLILNYNKSIVTKIYNTGPLGTELLGYDGSTIIPVLGKPLYSLAGFKWGGLDNSGNPQGFLNGKLTTDYEAINLSTNRDGFSSSSFEFKGTSSPSFFGSIINHFSWRRLSMSINTIFKMGYYFKKPVLSYRSLISQGLGHKDFEKRWRLPGDEMHTSVPSFLYPLDSKRETFYQFSTVNILKADNIRIHYINASYSVNRKVNIYFNLANVGIIWRASKESIDPDYISQVPPSKAFTVGVRANF